jgi:hypothetical protein
LYIGRRIGVFGVEGEHLMNYTADELARVANQTRELMSCLELPGQPQFWFQLEAQY